MSYRLSITENERCIVCEVSGPVTVDVAKQFSIDMDRISRARGIKRFLTDVRSSPNVSDVFQNYSFVNVDMKDLNLQRDVRAAILVSPSDHSHDFVETASRNAGYNVRVFDDEDAAFAWLYEGGVSGVESA